jgi:hypothetical protein
VLVKRNTKEENEAIKAGKTPERGLHRARRGWEKQPPPRIPFPRAVTESDSWELGERNFSRCPYDQGYDLDCD